MCRLFPRDKMAEGHDISGSDNEAVGEPDTELYQLKLDGSDWQYLQPNGERLIWTSDLESLKNFVENCLQQQGKWTSPGGNNKQFKSCNDKLVITWYFKKQLTLVFQGQDGPFLKEKLFKLVQDKPEMTTDSPNRPTSQNENQQTTDNGTYSGSENSLFAELRDIKYSLTVLKKQVDDNTSSLSRYPQNQENIGNEEEELMKQKGKCEKLQAALCNKDKEINALKMKIMSLETRTSSAEQENDSLKLALKLIMQEMKVGERQQQRNQSYEVTAPQGNSKSDNAQSNESSNPENEWQTVDAKKKKKKNKTRKKKISEAQSNAHEDTENSTSANESTTLLIGDSMIKNIQGTRLGKAVGHRVVVKSFSGATTKAMKDYLKPNLELSPDQVILHVGTNDLKSKEPQQVAGSVVDLARQIENSSDATVIISELVQRRDGFNEAVKTVNKQLKFYCRQNGWKFIQHQNISEKELNRGGLHLNFKGNQQFFKNFQMSLG